MTVNFQLLGPVDVRIGQNRVTLTGKQRSLLTVLLINANQVVATHRLAETVWGQPPPAAPETRVRVLVSELRKALAGAGRELLITRQPGYLISVEPGELDLDTFTALVERARREGTVEPYDQALALWQGAALGGSTGHFAETEAIRLEELRLGAIEDRADLLLNLGRHADLVGDLRRHVSAHPLRERPHAQLMTALHRNGRRGEALEIYQALRDRLVEELGLEPGAELQQVQKQILAEEPSRPVPAVLPAPAMRQLPPSTGPLIGREAALDTLDAHAAARHRLLLVAGAAGAGKTTLVVHWAHRAAGQYPDGQIYLNLRGFDPGARMAPAEALPHLLHALGVANDAIPVELDAQVGMYRSMMAGKRILLVLDNAGEADQVRPLLPGDPGCTVVLTSRDRLGGLVALDGARRLDLDVLSPQDAVEMLAQTAGADRVATDPAAALELVALCSHLPLALRIIGARLADQPHRTLRGQIAELSSAGRMASLQVDGDGRANVRGAFGLSYQALPSAARRMFRLFGLVAAPAGLSAAAAAALAGVPYAGPLLDSLSRLHLITPVAEDRYACHDLLREYSAELAATENPAQEREAAVHRLFDFYLHSVHRAANLTNSPVAKLPIDPPSPELPLLDFRDLEHIRAWMTLEWDNVIAAVRYAADQGPRQLSWQLVDALYAHYDQFLMPSLPEWLAIGETALAAARKEGNALGQAAILLGLAKVTDHSGAFRTSIEHRERAAALYREAHWPQGESTALRGLGVNHALEGRVKESVALFERALAIDVEIGNRVGETSSLMALANAHEELGNLEESTDYLTTLLPLLDYDRGQAIALSILGWVRSLQGRLDEAAKALHTSLELSRAVGLRRLEVSSLTHLGEMYLMAKRYDDAGKALSQALESSRTIEDSQSEIPTLTAMAALEIALGRTDGAFARINEALELIDRTGHQLRRADTLVVLADAYNADRRYDEAHEHAAVALDLAERAGTLTTAGRAGVALAASCFGRGEFARGVELAEEALRGQRRSGRLLAQAETLQLLAEAHEAAGDQAAADAYRARSRPQTAFDLPVFD